MIEDNARHKPWRATVAAYALSARLEACAGIIDGPVRLTLKFMFVKPKSVKKSRTLPCVKPDLSKLIRAVEDSLTGIIWRDDSLVVDIVARKVYADVAGVTVIVEVV
jgi:Holliday junction resolvase RusA-like endonuclease